MIEVEKFQFNFSGREFTKNTHHQNDNYEQESPVIAKRLFIKSKGRYWRLCPDQILFVQAAGSYVHIQTSSGRYTLPQNLLHFSKKTPLENLSRVHRSYLVNVSKVDSFEDSYLFIKDHKLPISESYKAEFMSKIHCL